MSCSCAHHNDGSVTTFICPLHADQDPCATMAAVTGKRRKGSVIRGVCSACGWRFTDACRETVRQLAGEPHDEECGEPIAEGEAVCRLHARLRIAAREMRSHA